MELGVLRFRCQGTNVLQGAVHKDHGLVWTEGRGIFLTPVDLYGGQVENQEHSKLGEFDRGVKSIHWSDNTCPGLCYMCVVHEKNISIWKVEGHQPKLSFKQVRKVNIQPIPQGCVWCPGRDILCVLCPLQASIYYSHVQNKGSQVLLQIDTDKVRCACWSKDGSKLIICCGTTLMVYEWSDVDKSVTKHTSISWQVPGLTGKISSIVPVSNSRIILAAELPLENLCKQQDTFVLPDLLSSNSSGPIRDSLTDETILRPKGKASVTETLLNLPRNPNSVSDESSRVYVIDVRTEQDPVAVCSSKVTAVLTPDLLLYQNGTSLLYVGCNTQSLIQVFSLTDDNFTKHAEIEVSKDERPKGLACLPETSNQGNDGVLILTGKKEQQDTALPSSSAYVNMKSILRFFNLKQGGFPKSQLSHTTSAPSIPVSVATNGQYDSNDYDPIYESVMNFSTSLKKDQGEITELRGVNNNNPHKPITKSSSVLVQSVAQKDDKRHESVKVGSGFRSSYHGDTKLKVAPEIPRSQDDMPVPPKRPIRKKKSMRANTAKEDVSRTSSSNSSVSTERSRADSGVKMPMEYKSDSSEFSPRDSPAESVRRHVDGGVVAVIDSPELARSGDIRSTDVGMETRSEAVNSERLACNQMSEDLSRSSDSGIVMNITSTGGGVNSNHSGYSGIVDLDTNGNQTKCLETQTVEFNSQPRSFQSADFSKLCSEEKGNTHAVEDLMERKLKSRLRSSDPASLVAMTGGTSGPVLSSSLESLDDIDKILKEQNEKITRLQEQMSKLSRRVDESSCVLPTRYKSLNKPDTVQLCFQCKDGFKIEKKFLLDNGRLQLQQIKHAFSLDTVEILIDGEACVVGCNIDGYIPIRFDPFSTVYIGGKPATG